MNDKVAPVYFEACKLLEYMISDYGKDLPADEVRAGIAPLMTSMLGNLGAIKHHNFSEPKYFFA